MNKHKKILNFLFYVLIIILSALIISYIFYSMIKNDGSYIPSMEMFSSKFFQLFFAGSTLFLLIGLVFFSIKFRLFNGSKILNNNDRVDSNLYDNSCFMSKKELYSTYGNYDISKLKDFESSNNEELYGIVANTEFNKKKNKIFCSLIKDTHCVMIGTTGAGKSTFQSGPMLQINARTKIKPSFVINDISGELYRKHSNCLIDNGYDVKIINLHTPRKGLRFNPLSIIWDLFYEYNNSLLNGDADYDIIDRCGNYIEDIASIICPEDKGEGKNWTQGARAILTGIIWGMLEDSLVPEFEFDKKMFTIAQISNIVNRQRGELENFLFLRSDKSKVWDCAGIIYQNRNEKGVDSYISSLSNALTLFKESGIQYITSGTDIDFFSITERPTAIFVIVPTEYKNRNLLAGIIYSQVYNMQVFTARKKQNGALSRPLYYILDEFGNLPKLESFHIWIATSRKMRIFFYLMVQSNNQLSDVYGKERANVILNQCQTHIFLGTNTEDDIEKLQKELGTYTAKSRSESIDTASTQIDSYKGNISLTKKYLVTATELKQIKQGQAFITQFRKKPLKANLISDFDKNALANGCFVVNENLNFINNKADFDLEFYNLSYRNGFFDDIDDEEDDQEILKNSSSGKNKHYKKTNTLDLVRK